jgi:hypothetical protein
LADADINAIMYNSRIGLMISNQYFDFENIEQPVQTFMDTSVEFMADPNTEVRSFFNVRRHNYKLNDNLFGINPSKKTCFTA